MEENEKPQWSADGEPRDVLVAFLQEVKNRWASSDVINWTELGLEITDEESHLMIEHINRVLLSLDSVITATRQYIASSKFMGDSELDRLMVVAHDWAAVVLVAKSLSAQLMQGDISEQDSRKLRRLLKNRLSQIDNMAKGADTLLKHIKASL